MRSALATTLLFKLLAPVLLFGIGMNTGNAQSRSNAEIAQAEHDEIVRLAAKEYPDLPPDEGAAKVALARNAARMKRYMLRDQQTLAAVGFTMYYRAHSEVRAAYCKKAGVDITPFLTAFKDAHSVELPLAAQILKAHGYNTDRDWVVLRPKAETVIETDMTTLAQELDTDAAGACRHAAEHAETLAAAMHDSADQSEERAVLLSYKPQP